MAAKPQPSCRSSRKRPSASSHVMSWAASDLDGRRECLREHGRSGGSRDRDFFGCASRLASSGNCAVATRKRTIQTQENHSRSSRSPDLPVTSRGIWQNRSGSECPPAPPCPGLFSTWTVVASACENTGDREDREIGISCCVSRVASSGNCAVATRKRTILTQENQSRSSRAPWCASPSLVEEDAAMS